MSGAIHSRDPYSPSDSQKGKHLHPNTLCCTGQLVINVDKCLIYATVLYLFAHRQTCSCEILQNPNCTLPNMHNAVYWPNTDWLTSGPVRKRSDSSLVQTRDVQRKKKKKSKIKNYIMKSRQWLLWTHLIAFNTWFNLSSLYVLTLLFSVVV